MIGYWIFLGSLAGVLMAAVLIGLFANRRQLQNLEQGKRTFHQRREWLEARFLTLASQSGKPRGLLWNNCDFDDDITFARDRVTGQLRALVAVTIQFTAEVGGDMEHVAAVGNLRAATAVFLYDNQNWQTDGRAIFNLNPTETIRHFGHELEPML